MGNSILILGDSGTGKSSSLRNLPSAETFIINVLGKGLPFRGANKSYIPLSEDRLTGNYFASDDPQKIKRAIKFVNEKRPEIKYLVVDDLGYTVMNEFMRKALIKGYDKYAEMGKNFGDIIEEMRSLRSDLFFIAMMHIETDKQGKTKPKTVGSMIDQYIVVEGNFTTILHTAVTDGKYKFIVNNDGIHMAKSIMGLFDTLTIDNDLMIVINKLNEFLNEDITI